MVRDGTDSEDSPMTESNAEPASAQPTPTATTAAPRLRRRATDRVAFGVASGLADYLNVDPLLVRVVLVGLVLFNGAGFFIYLAAWLFIPVEGSDTSIVEGWIRRLGAPGGAAWTIAWVVIAIIGTAVLFNIFDSVNGRIGFGSGTGFLLALVIIVGGILLVRRTTAEGAPSEAARMVAANVATSDATAPQTVVVRRERTPRESSPLGLYVLGLTLVALGALAVIDAMPATEILPGVYAGVALGVIGLGLVVGAWLGRARWLILIGILIVPFAIAMSFVKVPLDGEWGAQRAEPVDAADIPAEYRVSGGSLTVDLSELPRSTTEQHVAASVGMGRLLVILPDGARAEVTSEVGAGTSELFGDFREGTGLVYELSRDGRGSPFVLDLEAGLGSIEVRTASGEE
jgi:phage shock protein PspC (stress-responsive transcriptional regulator)